MAQASHPYQPPRQARILAQWSARSLGFSQPRFHAGLIHMSSWCSPPRRTGTDRSIDRPERSVWTTWTTWTPDQNSVDAIDHCRATAGDRPVTQPTPQPVTQAVNRFCQPSQATYRLLSLGSLALGLGALAKLAIDSTNPADPADRDRPGDPSSDRPGQRSRDRGGQALSQRLGFNRLALALLPLAQHSQRLTGGTLVQTRPPQVDLALDPFCLADILDRSQPLSAVWILVNGLTSDRSEAVDHVDRSDHSDQGLLVPALVPVLTLV